MGTQALYPNASSAVWPGGQFTFAVVFESFVDSNIGVAASDVTIGIAASDAVDSGTGTPLPATSTGVLAQGIGSYQYVWNVATTVAPGTYTVTWTGVRSSDDTTVTYVQNVTVIAAPAPEPVPGVYATALQYQTQTGDTFTPTATVAQWLRLASQDIDVALVGAVYSVDADGMPTDPGLIDTLVRATCMQAQYLVANNDPTGVKREYVSTNVGGVSVTRAASMQAPALPPLAPRALSILRVDGVLPSAPLVNW
ncbi:MAG TPA: hypothetical protein VHX38_18750 [Pseudonocardiaceae bacterium]|nr:hypothetical protein [Pseudonocardiaceae bacterium]